MMAWQDWQQWPVAGSQWCSRMFALAGQSRATVMAVNVLLILGLSYSLADLSWRLLNRPRYPSRHRLFYPASNSRR